MIYYFAIVFSVFFIAFIISLVKKDKLDEKYSILLLIFSIVILIVSIYPKIITIVANEFSVYYPPSLLLLFAILILGAYVLHITIVITKQNKMIVKLTQQTGILKQRIEELEDEEPKNKTKNA